MLIPACSFWDISYLLCTYTSIFIIFLIAWQVRRSYQGLSLEPKESCYQHHRKVRQRASDAASRARRLSREEAEKPWELLSIMKSQSWAPKEGNVRQLLCVDPSCQICEDTTLEIQQLLQSEKSQLSPALLGEPQGSARSAHLEMLPMSFEGNMELCSRHTRHRPQVPGNQSLTQLTGHLTQLTNTVGAQESWTDCLQLDQNFHLANMPMVSETMTSSRLKEPMVLMIEEKLVQSKAKLDQESQDLHRVKSSVSLLSLDPNLTHTMSLHMDSMLSSHLPLLSPKVRGLLELHVKKWIHFQKWGLPRRVEESLRQLMPDPTLLCRSRENLSSYILDSSSKVTEDRTGIVSHKTSLYLADQPIQTFWVSKWPVINLQQGRPWHQIHTCLSSHEAEHLRNFYPLPKAKANDSGDNLQSEYYSQLFCGLPSLHSESLDVTSLSSQGTCKKKDMPKPSADAQPSGVLTGLFLPIAPSKSALPSFPNSLNGKTPCEREGAQITVPFLTLAECEALERHLLEKQLSKLQWSPPALFLQNQYTQSRMPCEVPGETKPVKTSLARKPYLYPTRDIFPEHARRLLEFHLQKQLIHLRWGLPQRIQRSMRMLLSSTDPKSLPCGGRGSRRPNVSISQPGKPEADGSGDMFSLTLGKGTISMPHLFAETREMLKSHVDSKCEQIQEGKIPAQVWNSWECKVPGSLATMAPFSWIPQGQCRKLQAESKSDPDLLHKVVPWKPKTLSQETQTLSGTLFEHCKKPQSLPEETVKKLETTLHHKYLAFLSGLPALYCVALSRPVSPAVTSQPRLREKMPGAVKSPSRALTQITPLEPCAQDGSGVSADTAEKFQPGAEVDGRTGKVPAESQPPPCRPYPLNTHILAKLNFHLKKKILAMQFGISEKERRDYKELGTAGLENESIQEFLRSLHMPESTLLQEQPISCPSLPAPNAKRVPCKKQPAPAVQAVCQEQRPPPSKAVPRSSAQQSSKASQSQRDKTQVCVDMEARRKRSNLEKPKAVGDLGEGDAGLGFPLVSQKTRQDGEQEKQRLHRPRQGSSQQGHAFHLQGACPHSPRESPELQFPHPPPAVFMETDSEQDMEGSQSEESIVPEPARTAEAPQPVLSQASQGLPFPCSPTQRKPLQGQPGPGHFPPGHTMPASPSTRPSRLPEAGLKNKMKFFFHSINPKMKSKAHTEPSTGSTPGKVTKTSKENVERGLPRAKSPTKKTKPEDSRGPKAQFSSSEKSVMASLLTAPHILDSKLRPRSQQLGSIPILGNSHHCPRHCPRLAYATHHRNLP
ncbi:protein FAM205A-2-like [Mus pahari]|uniref:protein FAM205A-2-like n=1 Tax=Mus pahari TaxID=10093 RepID=UPI000A310506|nr:protein FAM205A-2-like [Mus pahari]